MIIYKEDGSEFCDLCEKTCDDICKKCNHYKYSVFTYNERTHTTRYHTFNRKDKDHD